MSMTFSNRQREVSQSRCLPGSLLNSQRLLARGNLFSVGQGVGTSRAVKGQWLRGVSNHVFVVSVSFDSIQFRINSPTSALASSIDMGFLGSLELILACLASSPMAAGFWAV